MIMTKNLKISAAALLAAVIIGMGMFGGTVDSAASSPWRQISNCIWQVLEFAAAEQPHHQ